MQSQITYTMAWKIFATSKNGGSINGCAIDGNLNGIGIIIVRFWL